MQKIIVIVGPTGVGKTKLSIELAKRLDAEIINGDSVAIYQKLNIGSAKPTIEEQQEVPHHLIDIKHPTEEYSVYDYQVDGRKKIEELRKRGKNIIVVGGTGLYIKALLYDYRFTKGTTNNKYEELSNEELYQKVKKLDEKIDIHPNNRKRLVRYLNKYENNEEITHNKDKPLYDTLVIGLTLPRDILYERINTRVENMIKEGLVEEVEGLKKYYKSSRVLTTAIGYKEFINYFTHKETLEEVVDKIKLDSRHYAKRQYTFFNHQLKTNWYQVNLDDFNKTIEKIYNDIKKEANN